MSAAPERPAAIRKKLERLSAHGRASAEFKDQWLRFEPEWKLATRRGNRSVKELALIVLEKLVDEEIERKGLA